MSNILPAGSLNPNATIAPGVYILEKLPSAPISGVETDVILTVGTGTWGPINFPVVIGNLTEQVNAFGKPTTEAFDMGTQVMAAASVGAINFLSIRVTDGTDIKAVIPILDNQLVPVTGMTVTAKYSGTVGNTINVLISEGTNSTIALPTFKITIYLPTGTGSGIPEIYDNIGGTGLALWQAMVDAINMGQGGQTAPSELVTAVIGTATLPPELFNYVLVGGTNGNSGVTATIVLGSDTLPLTGMYAASGADFSLMVLAGVTDSATFLAQAVFAANQGAYAMLARPLGESYATGITEKKTIGLVSYATKFMVGETWIKINDDFNNVQRYISQQGLIAGVFSLLPPEESGLNKVISSSIFISTYFSDQNKRYSSADIIQILQNGLDTIANPSPGGNYLALQTGKNTSNNILASTDPFTRLTNFIAGSLQDALGIYVGQLQNNTQKQSALTLANSFLSKLAAQNVIGMSNVPVGTIPPQPFSVAIDSSQAGIGIEIVNVRVAFFNVIVAILVNLQTGLQTISSVTQQ